MFTSCNCMTDCITMLRDFTVNFNSKIPATLSCFMLCYKWNYLCSALRMLYAHVSTSQGSLYVFSLLVSRVSHNPIYNRLTELYNNRELINIWISSINISNSQQHGRKQSRQLQCRCMCKHLLQTLLHKYGTCNFDKYYIPIIIIYIDSVRTQRYIHRDYLGVTVSMELSSLHPGIPCIGSGSFSTFGSFNSDSHFFGQFLHCLIVCLYSQKTLRIYMYTKQGDNSQSMHNSG